MTSRLRRAAGCLILGLGTLSLRAGAEVVEAAHSPSAPPVQEASAKVAEFSPLGWGLLVGLVLLALAVVARSGRRPD